MKNLTSEIPEGYLRVTEILEPFKDFSKIDKETLDKAADRGTRVHAFCQLECSDMLFGEVDEDCRGYFESFLKWKNQMIDEVGLLEKRFNCDEHKISGQIDMIVKLKGSNEYVIVDLKTPASESKTWRLQTAAYLYLVRRYCNPHIHRRACLMLDKSGRRAKFKEYTAQKDERLFFNALELMKFFKKEMGLKSTTLA